VRFLDLYSFLAVLLRGLVLTLETLAIGGVSFQLLARGCGVAGGVRDACRRLAWWSAAALAAAEAATVACNAAMLVVSADLAMSEIAGAPFVWFDGGACVAALGLAFVLRGRARWGWAEALSAVLLAASVASSHAAARLEARLPLMALTAVHQLAAALWIGGLPYLWIASRGEASASAAQTITRRFSRLAMGCVAALFAAGVVLTVVYSGSWAGFYGTSYGAMIAAKAVLLGFLVVLGALNFRIARGGASEEGQRRLRWFAEAEIGIGITAILAAASLTSQPPAADVPEQWTPAGVIAARMAPQRPLLETPPIPTTIPPADPLAFVPRSLEDILWSEYNHHWAGLIVLAAGLLAMIGRTRRGGWARNWPLLFLGLAAFILVRADADTWPLGPRGFWESMETAEIAQHRLFAVLVAAFGLFEWAVRVERLRARWAAMVFPLVCAAGGALLLTHSHSFNDVRAEFLAELSHLPLAVLAVGAGWARWLEMRLPKEEGKMAGRVWPVCFALIGLVLLNYRER
jgi:putative copper resistance protein D